MRKAQPTKNYGMNKPRIIIILLLFCLLISAYYNIKPDKSSTETVSFGNANTRPTYDYFHHIKEAQYIATGKGIKVGIIDKYFGYADNKNVYSGGMDFTGNNTEFEKIAEHGLWMATTLKEIAPDVEIYALNARSSDRRKEGEAILKAIDWAIENGINILTYSAEPFREEDRYEIDKAVLKAVMNNIVITFIHYDLPENILPNGLFPKSPASYKREADVNILHFDYNTLLLSKYKDFVESGRRGTDKNGDLPYFSNSSMSPVLAGIIAMMVEVNNNLTPADYKRILIETSKEIDYEGHKVKHVVDATDALKYLMEEKNLVWNEKN